MKKKHEFAPRIATHNHQLTVNEKAIQKEVLNNIISGVISAGVAYLVFNKKNQ